MFGLTRTAFVLVLAGLAALAPLRASGEILEQVLLKVNGEIFTKTELEERQVAFLRQQNRQYTEEELGRELAQITPQIMATVVDEMVLVQRARELGYRLSDEQFRDIIDRLKQENQIETEEQFEAALAQEGLTMEDLRRTFERQALIARLQQVEIMRSVSITEVELEQYYDGHQEAFRTTPTVTLREILIEVPTDSRGLNVAADDAARAKAEDTRARIRGGEDFGRVAGEISDAPSRANGGLIGPIDRTELSPSVLERIDALRPGETSDVVRTPRGYHFLKLESATEATVQPFADVRDEVAELVSNERRQSEMRKYVEKLRGQAVIEWKNADLQKAYESFRTTLPPSS